MRNITELRGKKRVTRMTESATPRLNVKTASTLLALAVFGFSANYLKLPIAFSVDFIFGSIFSIIALRLFGTAPGIGVALIASSCTYLLWNHPYAIIILVAEILWLDAALKRNRSSILLIDCVFWLALGGPLVAVFYGLIMHLSMQSTILVILKQGINGIFNALIASLILTYIPFESILATKPRPAESYSARVMNLLGLFLMVPTLLLLSISSHKGLKTAETEIVRELTQETSEKADILAKWTDQHINAAYIIAEQGNTYPSTPLPQIKSQ